jgi:hypothetical protein
VYKSTKFGDFVSVSVSLLQKNFQNEINVSGQHFKRIFVINFSYRFLSLFAIFAVASLVQSAPTVNKGKINCYITHLKGLNLLNAAYPEFDEHLDNCDESIEALKKDIYRKFALTIRRKPDFGSFTPCIMDDLRSRHWVEDMMLSTVYEASKTLTQDEKNLKTATLEAQSHRNAKLAFTSCVSKESFGGLFDRLFKEIPAATGEDPIEDYCERKYVIDAGLVDTTKFNFPVNPNNLDVSNVDCEPHLKNSFKEFDTLMITLLQTVDNFELGEQEINCAMEKYHANKLQDKLFRLSALRSRIRMRCKILGKLSK